MLITRCDRIICELSADRCQLPLGHDGPCRAMTWRELQEACDVADDGPAVAER